MRITTFTTITKHLHRALLDANRHPIKDRLQLRGLLRVMEPLITHYHITIANIILGTTRFLTYHGIAIVKDGQTKDVDLSAEGVAFSRTLYDALQGRRLQDA